MGREREEWGGESGDEEGGRRERGHFAMKVALLHDRFGWE